MEIPSYRFISAEWNDTGKIIYDLALCGALIGMRFHKICLPSYAIKGHKCVSPTLVCDIEHRVYPVAKISSENIEHIPSLDVKYNDFG
jgi:hypothetical protein